MSSTTWLGVTTDATLHTNWSNGVPDGTLQSNYDVFIGASPSTSLTGFGSICSQATLTTTGNFSDTETVVIDSKTYTMQTVLTDSDGHVQIGADANESLGNLVAAINLDSGAGTKYASSTTQHTTCGADQPTSATMRAIYFDAGTAGDGTTTSETCANASWSGNLAGGASSGATMNNIYTDDDYTGDLNSNGSEAEISCNKFFWRGSGTAYLSFDSCNRMIVDSTNTYLAAQIINTSGIVSLEIVRGTATLNQNAVSDATQRVVVTGSHYEPSKLTLTGTGTIGIARNIGGFLYCNGPDVTTIINHNGRCQITAGTTTTIYNGGRLELETTNTVTTVEDFSGVFDMTTTAAAKTVTTFWQYPACELIYRTDFDTITSLKRIGVD